MVCVFEPHGRIPHVLLKALPPVCMKYTASDESRVANIAEAKPRVLYLSRDSHQELYTSIQTSGSALSVLLYFTPKNCVNRRHSFEI